MVGIITITLLFFFGIYLYLIYGDFYWSRGKIPPNFRFTKENEVEIFIALAGNILSKDFKDIRNKHAFVASYIRDNFRDEMYNFTDSFRSSYKSPIKLESIANWYNSNNASHSYKLSALQFAVAIASIDGDILENEYRSLKFFAKKMNLTSKDFDQIINVFYSRKQEERSQRQTTSTYDSSSMYYNVLGLNKGVSFIEIKKAYRKLVKKHHPDRFVNENAIQQKMAKERFIAIQEAYEYFEKRMA